MRILLSLLLFMQVTFAGEFTGGGINKGEFTGAGGRALVKNIQSIVIEGEVFIKSEIETIVFSSKSSPRNIENISYIIVMGQKIYLKDISRINFN